MQRQAGAVGLGKSHALPPGQLFAHQLGQHTLQRIGSNGIANQAALYRDGHAHVKHFKTQAIGLRHKVAGRIRCTTQTPCGGAGQVDVGLHAAAAKPFKNRTSIGRAHLGDDVQRFITPLQTHNFAVLTQQVRGREIPGFWRAFTRLQGLKALNIAGKASANIGHDFSRIALKPALDLAGLIPACQPDQSGQQSGHQRQQQDPQGPALGTITSAAPVSAKATAPMGKKRPHITPAASRQCHSDTTTAPRQFTATHGGSRLVAGLWRH